MSWAAFVMCCTQLFCKIIDQRRRQACSACSIPETAVGADWPQPALKQCNQYFVAKLEAYVRMPQAGYTKYALRCSLMGCMSRACRPATARIPAEMIFSNARYTAYWLVIPKAYTEGLELSPILCIQACTADTSVTSVQLVGVWRGQGDSPDDHQPGQHGAAERDHHRCGRQLSPHPNPSRGLAVV